MAAKKRGLSPSDIVGQAYAAVLAENNARPSATTPPEFWTGLRNNFTWRGTKLRDWAAVGVAAQHGPLRGVPADVVQPACFAGPFKAPINAGDAFQLLVDFPKDPNYLTFRNGFSTLPNAVSDRLPAQVEVLLGTNVDRIEHSATGFTLALTKAPDQLSSYPHIPDGEGKTLETVAQGRPGPR